MTSRPLRLAIAIGDPAGIGPEIVAKGLAQFGGDVGVDVEWVVIGNPTVLAGMETASMASVSLVELETSFDPARDAMGVPSASSGAAAVAFLLHAIDLANRGEVDGVVTAPLSKEAMRLAGHPWSGQTEVLVERTRANRAVMLFVGGELRVALATRHIALRDVASQLCGEGIVDDLLILDRSLRDQFGLSAPRIGVCGLNPHAGESGLFGDEEETVIRPALEVARQRGIDATGPLPADTLFVRQRRGEFDAVLAMYHDQGLIPVKLLAFGGGVNVSIGLPFIRTSPDHGTAYDIAGKGRADPASFVEAMRIAVDVASRERRAATSRATLKP